MKKLLSVILTVLCLLFLISCSSDDKKTQSEETDKSFIAYCEDRAKLDDNAKATVNAILDTYQTTSCVQAYKLISENDQTLAIDKSIKDLTPITYLKDLKTVVLLADVDQPTQLDITPLVQLKKLEVLNISLYEIVNYEQLQLMAPLKMLVLISPNSLFDLDGDRKNFVKTEEKTVINFDTLAGFENLHGLNALALAGYGITDITKIKNFANLQKLMLGDNNITDLTGIEDLTKLDELDLTNNPLDEYFDSIQYNGEYIVEGKESVALLQHLVTNYNKDL